jgi:acetylornithine/N-succinyldiaminopimelate aminotransferase
MIPFDVYPVFDINPVKAEGSYLWDDKGTKYLDFYGGHAVISIGHSHPYYVKKISEQLSQIGFYSNSVKIPMQAELAEKLGKLSGYTDYQLFLCNSGAEANENALKLASFVTGRKKVIAFTGAFHGRTSLAVAATDNPKIVAPVNATENIVFVPFNDTAAFLKEMDGTVAAVIVEGIQGVAGIQLPTADFLETIQAKCKEFGAKLILDEVQSGYGRTGRFFAHQHFGVKPDIITTAKGMGNGFPVAGVLIAPDIKPTYGMLGTTFGGAYLACAASIAVLDVMEQENLMANAQKMGDYILSKLQGIAGIKEIRALGLMVGVDMEKPAAELRRSLVFDHKVFTGADGAHTVRLLPALNITPKEADTFIDAFKKAVEATK